MIRGAVVVALVALLLPATATAADYPCPSDPGFCYRDVGDDGCFDDGVDEGPINDELEAQSTFNPAPPPGSIVCPPSVIALEATDDSIRLGTPPGSSILLYSARVDASLGWFEVASGADLLVGGLVSGGAAGALLAIGDVVLRSGVVVAKGQTGHFRLESSAGSVTIGPKARLRVQRATILADGDVTFLDKVRLSAGVNLGGASPDVRIGAVGDVKMTRPRIVSINKKSSGVISIAGANVVFHDKATIKGLAGFGPRRVEIIATAGDVTADRLSIVSGVSVEISATNIVIGTATNGASRPSKITERDFHVELAATDTIQVSNIRLTSKGNVSINTTGTIIDVWASQLRGRKGTPTITISAGPGSTCDLTGTVVKRATLVTSCDSVVGP